MTEAELLELKRDVQVLKDIEAIERVRHVYFRCNDTANIDELRQVLHPGLHAKFVGGSYSIEFHNRDDYLEMVANSFHSEFVGLHTGHHPEIDVMSETEATGRWYLADIAMDLKRGDRTTGSALYTERYLKTDGRWQIADTEYFRLYEIVEPVTERPNLTAHYLKDHGRKEIAYNVTELYKKG
ncbi:MAG TPA: nuclear transport factor 2 family protein [Alphaproteobacteria bacterium]|jgi:bile-acid 7alpha-dehydratase|nr:nuclear transport factor 2 family protein [Alphaproteobacteria bacterium]